MDHASVQEIVEVLHDLLVRLRDRLPGKDITLVAEFIDVGEFGLALEQVADVLSEDEQPLTPDERAEMLALARRMQMGDRCPESSNTAPRGEAVSARTSAVSPRIAAVADVAGLNLQGSSA